MKILKVKYKNQILDVALDDEDYDIYSKYKWFYKGGYIITNNIKTEGNNYSRLHRLIIKPQKNEVVDHINGNTLDNRKCNLRISTKNGNNQNARKMTRSKPLTSKYKGVSWSKQINGWKVGIRHNNKLVHVGYFNNEDAAGLAYNIKAIEYFGEFAWLNNINNSIDNIEIFRIKRKKKSQFFGVTWDKRKNKWEAQLYINKTVKHLGSFNSEEDAALKVNNFIIENNLNKPLNKIPSSK